MFEKRRYRRAGTRYLLINLLSILPFAGLLVYLFLRSASGVIDAWTWFLTAVFIIGGLLTLRWQQARARHLSCPSCGGPTIPGGPDDSSAESPDFICMACNIHWETDREKRDDQ